MRARSILAIESFEFEFKPLDAVDEIPSTSSSSPKVMNRDTEVTKDTMLPTNNGSTEDVQHPVVQVQSQNPIFEPVVDPVSAPMPNQRTSIPFPSRRNDERRREKANDQIENSTISLEI
ncbi:hypothetical protein Tco_0673121 [Tanacetum coccineum]